MLALGTMAYANISPILGNITLTTQGSGNYVYSSAHNPMINITGGGSSGTWASSVLNGGYTVANQSSIQVKGDAEFEGKVTINGQDLAHTLNKIQERLAILVPDPKRLAKYQALQEAYEHYKTLEALCVEENNPNSEQ